MWSSLAHLSFLKISMVLKKNGSEIVPKSIYTVAKKNKIQPFSTLHF